MQCQRKVNTKHEVRHLYGIVSVGVAVCQQPQNRRYADSLRTRALLSSCPSGSHTAADRDRLSGASSGRAGTSVNLSRDGLFPPSKIERDVLLPAFT